MAVTLKVSAEHGLALADARQFPVIKIQVLSQVHVKMAPVIGVKEINGTRYIVFSDMGSLCGNGRIEMGIEYITQILGLLTGNLNGIAAAVIEYPPIGLKSVLVLYLMSLGILTYLTAGESGHTSCSRSVHQFDECDELLPVAHAE